MAVKRRRHFDNSRLRVRSPCLRSARISVEALGARERTDQWNRRHGFVLPMTLLVIALAAIVMVGVARRSMQLAADANQAHLDLQRKWGTISCQRTLLDHADQWLSLPPDALPTATGDAGHLRTVFSLGNCQFDVLLADENAKVNLNALQQSMTGPEIVLLTTELAQSSEPLRVDLRPHSFAAESIVGAEKHGTMARLHSWGQVFPMQQFSDPLDAPRRIAAATVHLTCWGNGKLNVHTANEAALNALCRRFGNSSLTRQLMNQRQTGIILEEIISKVDLASGQVNQLATYLTDQSSTYSMWLNVRAAKRSWYEFYVISHRNGPSNSRRSASGNPMNGQQTTALRATTSSITQQARFTW